MITPWIEYKASSLPGAGCAFDNASVCTTFTAKAQDGGEKNRLFWLFFVIFKKFGERLVFVGMQRKSR